MYKVFLVGIFGEQFEEKAVLTREQWRPKKTIGSYNKEARTRK